MALVANSGGTTVSRIDLVAGTVTNITVAGAPYDVVSDPSGTYAYVTVDIPATTSDVVTRIDFSNGSTTDAVVGSGPTGIYVDPAGAYAYVNLADESVARVNLADLSVTSGFLTNSPGTISITADGNYIFSLWDSAKSGKYSNSGSRIESVYTLMGSSGGSGFNADGSNIYLVEPGGYVRGRATSSNTGFDWYSPTIVGAGASDWLSIGNAAYIPASTAGTVTKVSLADFSMTTVATGVSEPMAVAAPSDGSFILVTARGSDEVVKLSLPTAPGAPSAPTIDVGDGSLTATVTQPASGGVPTSFRIELASDSAQYCTVTGSSGYCTISGLTNGTAYRVKARATNAEGDSAWSSTSSPATPVQSTPAAPQAPIANGQTESASVSVTPATDASRATATSYRVEAVEDNARFCTVTGATGSCTVVGLTGGLAYTFVSYAISGAFTSAVSPASSSVTVVSGTPAVPGRPSATAGQQAATVTVNPTTNASHVAASSFVVETVQDPSRTCTVAGPSGSCVVSGLTPGWSYTFVSYAITGARTSAASIASAVVVPTASPNASTQGTGPVVATGNTESASSGATTGASVQTGADAGLPATAGPGVTPNVPVLSPKQKARILKEVAQARVKGAISAVIVKSVRSGARPSTHAAAQRRGAAVTALLRDAGLAVPIRIRVLPAENRAGLKPGRVFLAFIQAKALD